MATLTESLEANLEGYKPIPLESRLGPSPGEQDLQPRFNPMIRCPLPPMQVSPDNLRQFYLGGAVPQMRILAPLIAPQGSGGTVIEKTSVTSPVTSSSSSSSTSLSAVQRAITTPVLNPGDIFAGSLLLAKSFQLLQVSANSPCRIQLYGTALAQNIDSSRGLDAPPSAGVFQNIISDVALDTSPYQWPYQNRMGANGDSPQTSLIYISITNLDVASDAITVTINFVPLES
jgi:hypothetical protein